MHVRGTISSVGFESGDRFVIGCWAESPVGRLADVMWVDAFGHRTLITDTDEGAAFITSIYAFDDVTIAPLVVRSAGARTTVETDRVHLELEAGRRRLVPVARPRSFTRFIEAPIARRLMGVECYGTSPLGAREWYQARWWRWVNGATGELDGRDLGRPTALQPPLRVGFSEPPRRPSIVSVRVAIEPAPGSDTAR